MLASLITFICKALYVDKMLLRDTLCNKLAKKPSGGVSHVVE